MDRRFFLFIVLIKRNTRMFSTELHISESITLAKRNLPLQNIYQILPIRYRKTYILFLGRLFGKVLGLLETSTGKTNLPTT